MAAFSPKTNPVTSLEGLVLRSEEDVRQRAKKRKSELLIQTVSTFDEDSPSLSAKRQRISDAPDHIVPADPAAEDTTLKRSASNILGELSPSDLSLLNLPQNGVLSSAQLSQTLSEDEVGKINRVYALQFVSAFSKEALPDVIRRLREAPSFSSRISAAFDNYIRGEIFQNWAENDQKLSYYLDFFRVWIGLASKNRGQLDKALAFSTAVSRLPHLGQFFRDISPKELQRSVYKMFDLLRPHIYYCALPDKVVRFLTFILLLLLF